MFLLINLIIRTFYTPILAHSTLKLSKKRNVPKSAIAQQFRQRYTLEMSIDIELTLNRFGFGKIAENKFQLFWLRFSKWKIPNKYSISFEINWRAKDKSKTELQ